MRFQHRFCLLLFLGVWRLAYGGWLERSTFRRTRPVIMNIKYLIEPESGEKLLTAIPTVNDVKMAPTKFLQPQRHARHRSHECGIHHGAIC